MKEQFVPYEIALKLKEKGFMEECFGFYYYDGSFKKYRLVYEESSNDYLNSINAPLWQQVIDWLRTEHNIYLWVYKYYDDEVEKDLYRFDMKNGGFYSSFYNTSEEARQAAIQHALTLI